MSAHESFRTASRNSFLIQFVVSNVTKLSLDRSDRELQNSFAVLLSGAMTTNFLCQINNIGNEMALLHKSTVEANPRHILKHNLIVRNQDMSCERNSFFEQ